MLRELFQKDRLAETIEENEKKFNELLARAKEQSEREKLLFQELGISGPELIAFFEDRRNFTDDQWEKVQFEMNAIDAHLKINAKDRRDASKARQAYNDRSQIQRHWLPVR